jgi:hypothetical protein
MSYPTLTPCNVPVSTSLATSIPNVAVENQTFALGIANAYEVDANGDPTTVPLGQSGPFVVTVDAEEILCSSFAEGVAEVFEDEGTNGRGWNSTTITVHNAGAASVSITSTSVQSVATGGGSVAGVQLVQKGPFKFTFEDYAELLTGVLLWNAAAGDSPQFIMISVPVTPFDGGTGASVTADSAPTLPLTIVTGVNDTFVYTGDGGLGTPETFTMANAAVATTLAELEAIVEAALGSVSGEPFSTYVAVTDNGTNLVFTMKTVGVAASAQNSNTITEGDGGAAAIGIEAPPATFENGVGPTLNVTLGDDPIAPNVSDVSMVDAPNPGYGNLQSVGGVALSPGVGAEVLYISAAQAGLPYNALFASDPGALTQGECYVYGLLYPELIQTT